MNYDSKDGRNIHDQSAWESPETNQGYVIADFKLVEIDHAPEPIVQVCAGQNEIAKLFGEDIEICKQLFRNITNHYLQQKAHAPGTMQNKKHLRRELLYLDRKSVAYWREMFLKVAKGYKRIEKKPLLNAAIAIGDKMLSFRISE